MNRLRGSMESIDFIQAKQSKISLDVHDRESSKDNSAKEVPVVSFKPAVTPSVSDQASADAGVDEMESSDVVPAVHRGPSISTRVTRPDPRPPAPCKDGDSHHSPEDENPRSHGPARLSYR